MDRRAARTRNALHRALMSLVVHKGYDAITVQDILDEADVGRSTFYAHYTGKEDLLRRGFETLRVELLEAQRNAAAETGAAREEPLPFSLALFEHACGNRFVYEALAAGSGGAVAANELRRILSEAVTKDVSSVQHDASVPRDLQVRFVVSTFLTTLNWWLEQRSREDPAQVNAMFRHLIIDGIGASDHARRSDRPPLAGAARWRGNSGTDAAQAEAARKGK